MLLKKKISLSLLNNQEENDYKKNGWVKVSKLISKTQVDNIKKTIHKFLNQNNNNYDKKNINYLTNNKNEKIIHSFHKLSDSKSIREFGMQKKFLNIAEQVIGEKSKFRKCELFAKPSRIGIKSPPHQDNFYWCLKNGNSITIWIALDKSNEENGAMYYYNGSHKLGLVDHIASNIKGSSQKVKDKNLSKKFKKITPSLDIGDALIHDSHVIHGSTRNKSNKNRMGLTIQFQSQKCMIDEKRQKIYSKSLSKQIKKRSDARI